MSAVHSKKKSRPRRKTCSSGAAGSPYLTASQLLTRLFDLLEHVGIAIPAANSFIESFQMEQHVHPLYPHATPIGEMLTAWHQNSTYLDRSGDPAPIKFRGRGPSFQDLAKKMVPGIKPSQLLLQLERLGVVKADDQGLIRVRMRSFPAFEDKELAKQHTLSSLNDFITTLRHNLDSVPANFDQLFHRIARIDDFDRRGIPALKVRVKRRGQNFLESIDDYLSSNGQSKSTRPIPLSRKVRVSVGVYLSVEDR
jgi:uncharacterized protein DUF6502